MGVTARVVGRDRKSTGCFKPDNDPNYHNKATYKVHCDFQNQGFTICEDDKSESQHSEQN